MRISDPDRARRSFRFQIGPSIKVRDPSPAAEGEAAQDDTQDDFVKMDEVQLRDVKENDLPVFFEQQLEPEANRMAAFPARNREAFMQHWIKILSDESVYTKTILFNERVAGNIVSFEQFGVRAVGYWLGKEYWGRGIATQALFAFLGHVKERPLYAYVAKHNIASRRVLEKCGFTLYSEDNVFSDATGEVIEEFILKLG